MKKHVRLAFVSEQLNGHTACISHSPLLQHSKQTSLVQGNRFKVIRNKVIIWPTKVPRTTAYIQQELKFLLWSLGKQALFCKTFDFFPNNSSCCHSAVNVLAQESNWDYIAMDAIHDDHITNDLAYTPLEWCHLICPEIYLGGFHMRG